MGHSPKSMNTTQGNCIAVEYGELSRGEIQTKYEFDRGMIKGEFVAMHLGGVLKSLFICCPGCGDCSFTSTHKIESANGFYTANPSLVFQCCQWHGHLKSNVFEN